MAWNPPQQLSESCKETLTSDTIESFPVSVYTFLYTLHYMYPGLLKVEPFSPAKADTCVGFGASPVTSTSIHNLSPGKAQRVMTVRLFVISHVTATGFTF